MLVIYSILLAILLGLWAWTRRAAWSIPVVIVAILLVATWLDFRWEVTALLVLAVVIVALAILFARVILGLILGVMALLVAAVIGFGFVIPNIIEAPKASVGTPATSAPASQPTTCEAKFVQVKADYGPDNRVDGTFEKAYASATANKSGVEKENAQRELILKHSANNGQRLAIWAHANGLYDNAADWKKLVAGDCLSSEGQALYYKLEGALSAGGVKFSEGDAPQSGHNSGVLPDGTYVVAENPGIVSNTKAIVITYKDGTKVHILIYCGNVVFPAPPQGVPTSPKIPQPEKPVPPTTPPVTPPTPVTDCTATPTLPECLTPKGGNWIAPTPGGDGTTDSEGQWQQYGPGEFTGPTPPKVIQQQPGASSGGTVVDSPTKAPQQETGGQAPGAKVEVKPSKPAETGANDPGVQNPDQPAVGGNDGHIDNPFG